MPTQTTFGAGDFRFASGGKLRRDERKNKQFNGKKKKKSKARISWRLTFFKSSIVLFDHLWEIATFFFYFHNQYFSFEIFPIRLLSKRMCSKFVWSIITTYGFQYFTSFIFYFYIISQKLFIYIINYRNVRRRSYGVDTLITSICYVH